MKFLHTLGDIVKQFKATNHIFDHLVSLTFVSCLVGALIYPIFVFLDISGRCWFGFCFSASIILFSPFAENLKAMMIILYLIALGNNCFVISVFNDSFVSKARPFTLFDQVRANPEWSANAFSLRSDAGTRIEHSPFDAHVHGGRCEEQLWQLPPAEQHTQATFVHFPAQFRLLNQQSNRYVWPRCRLIAVFI